ncbi:hypothetical protein C8R44DRAFT_768307 [Mycena epipterygia]|nr:hypothetical protein C8R44DRAFT_768307 [Mycena epipterygia]
MPSLINPYQTDLITSTDRECRYCLRGSPFPVAVTPKRGLFRFNLPDLTYDVVIPPLDSDPHASLLSEEAHTIISAKRFSRFGCSCLVLHDLFPKNCYLETPLFCRGLPMIKAHTHPTDGPTWTHRPPLWGLLIGQVFPHPRRGCYPALVSSLIRKAGREFTLCPPQNIPRNIKLGSIQVTPIRGPMTSLPLPFDDTSLHLSPDIRSVCGKELRPPHSDTAALGNR